MKKLELNQRIIVAIVDRSGGEKTDTIRLSSPVPGTVVRLRRRDKGAWVSLEHRYDDRVHPFPEGDPRANHVLTYPEWCGPEGCSYE